jgi:hypothetical protein
MTILMGKSCRALVDQVLPCCVTGVFSPSRREPFLRSTSPGQSAVLNH